MAIDLSLLRNSSVTKTQRNRKVKKNTSDFKAAARANKFKLKHQKRITSLEQIASVPENGEIYNILSNSQFNAFTFIPFVMKYKSIKEISIITYNISEEVIRNLCDLLEREEIERLNIFVSDHVLRRRANVAKLLIRKYKELKKLNIGFTYSHAKITIMDNYVITGSGNMNQNARTEQYILANSKEMAGFFKENYFDLFPLDLQKAEKELKNGKS